MLDYINMAAMQPCQPADPLEYVGPSASTATVNSSQNDNNNAYQPAICGKSASLPKGRALQNRKLTRKHSTSKRQPKHPGCSSFRLDQRDAQPSQDRGSHAVSIIQLSRSYPSTDVHIAQQQRSENPSSGTGSLERIHLAFSTT